MTTKTPSGLAAGGAGSDDETIDDSLDEILLHATERPLENPLRSSIPTLQLPRTGTATLLGVPSPSLPIPGMVPAPEVAPAPDPEPAEITPAVAPRADDVTQIARSSLLDDPTDDETKADPLETARRAAASKDEVEVALTEQASAEREKALRKSFPPGPRIPAPQSGPEFEDPEDADTGPRAETELANDTPAAIRVDEDEGESTANDRGPLAGAPAPAASSSPSPSPLALGGARLPPPSGQPFGARLPTPSAGFSVPAPSPAFGIPAPSVAVAGAPYSLAPSFAPPT